MIFYNNQLCHLYGFYSNHHNNVFFFQVLVDIEDVDSVQPELRGWLPDNGRRLHQEQPRIHLSSHTLTRTRSKRSEISVIAEGPNE